MIAVNVAQWGGGVEIAKQLEANDIILNYKYAAPAIVIRAIPPAYASAFPK